MLLNFNFEGHRFLQKIQMKLNGCATKGDLYHKQVLTKILKEGTWDINPRPKWADGEPAHTISINHVFTTYDLANGENPLITLRPIATKSALSEILWIYKDGSNDLEELKKYGVTWWDEWDIGNRTIGSCYGHTIKRYDQLNKLIADIRTNPDGRRHIMNMWQLDEFEEKHGLKPCCYETIWNVRHGENGIDYLDMHLTQRSSDFCTAFCINELQYVALLNYVASTVNMVPGRFSHTSMNVQIYDRHIDNARELIKRKGVVVDLPFFFLSNYDSPDEWEVEDVLITYDREAIKEKNPAMKFEVAI